MDPRGNWLTGGRRFKSLSFTQKYESGAEGEDKSFVLVLWHIHLTKISGCRKKLAVIFVRTWIMSQCKIISDFIFKVVVSQRLDQPCKVAHSQLNIRSNRIVINYLVFLKGKP